jgi:hypothetical protein
LSRSLATKLSSERNHRRRVVRGPRTSLEAVCTTMKWDYHYPRGPRSCPSYVVSSRYHLIDPIRPTRGHIAISLHGRLIRDVFAVRERLSDPRVVPSFRCTFLPDMPPSPTPGSPKIVNMSREETIPATAADFGIFRREYVRVSSSGRHKSSLHQCRSFEFTLNSPKVRPEGYEWQVISPRVAETTGSG